MRVTITQKQSFQTIAENRGKKFLAFEGKDQKDKKSSNGALRKAVFSLSAAAAGGVALKERFDLR